MHANQLSLLTADAPQTPVPFPAPPPREIRQCMADLMLHLVISSCPADGGEEEAPHEVLR
jgi:hypothetical protein